MKPATLQDERRWLESTGHKQAADDFNKLIRARGE